MAVTGLLEGLLAILSRGRASTLDDLAREIDASSELIEHMLDQLARAGYIRAVGGSCAGQCAGCGYGRGCAEAHNRRIWIVTDRARMAADTRAHGPRPPAA